MASVNKCIFIGNVGNKPEIKSMQSGDKVANFSIACTETWKKDGEKKEKTEWVRVVVFNQPLVKLIENYVDKGSKLYIEGQMETRSYEKDGQKVFTTEIVLRPYRGEITLLDSRGGEKSQSQPETGSQKKAWVDELEDEIPF